MEVGALPCILATAFKMGRHETFTLVMVAVQSTGSAGQREVSTLEERIEASVWLESHQPDASPASTRRYFASVDAYYHAHPIAYRAADLLTGLRQDTQAFAAIDAAVIRGDDPDEAWADVAASFSENMIPDEGPGAPLTQGRRPTTGNPRQAVTFRPK